MVHENKYVRWAGIDDAKDLVHLNSEFNGVCQEVERVKASLDANQELVVIAVLNEQIVGFACAQRFTSFCYEDAHAEITEMYVQEHARKKGLATIMISLLEEGLRNHGIRIVKLLTAIDNEGAINVYEHIGYQKEDDLLMTKSL